MFGIQMVDRALTLAGAGFVVFPCRNDKTPATPHGFKDASRDAEWVRALWRRYPGALIGIACGPNSDLAVLDLDSKHQPARAWWAENRTRLPETYTVRTRSGGLHLYFRFAPGLACSAGKIAPGVDIRAAGGYVISWPAADFPILHEAARADWPSWLLGLTQATQAARSNTSSPTRVPDNHALAGLVRKIAGAPEGERNRIAFWAACRMGDAVRSGMIGQTTAVALVEHAAIAAGLPQPEARRTATSGINHGSGG